MMKKQLLAFTFATFCTTASVMAMELPEEKSQVTIASQKILFTLKDTNGSGLAKGKAQDIREEGKTIIITTKPNSYSYLLETERFKVNSGEKIKVPYEITVGAGGKMALCFLDTAKKGILGKMLYLAAGPKAETFKGVYETVVPENEKETSLLIRNFQHTAPQSTFTITSIDIEKEEAGASVITSPINNFQRSTSTENDEKKNCIEITEDLNATKTATYIGVIETHVHEENDKIAEHLVEILQNHLGQEDDFNLAASIDMGNRTNPTKTSDSVVSIKSTSEKKVTPSVSGISRKSNDENNFPGFITPEQIKAAEELAASSEQYTLPSSGNKDQIIYSHWLTFEGFDFDNKGKIKSFYVGNSLNKDGVGEIALYDRWVDTKKINLTYPGQFNDIRGERYLAYLSYEYRSDTIFLHSIRTASKFEWDDSGQYVGCDYSKACLEYFIDGFVMNHTDIAHMTGIPRAGIPKSPCQRYAFKQGPNRYLHWTRPEKKGEVQ